jgi:pimeloyl-ACP methyl ester carboxylesterase
MKSRHQLIQMRNQFFGFILIASLLCQGLSTHAQTRRSTTKSQTAANNKTAPAQKCSGAWTGVVKYTRNQTGTNDKVVPRVSGRGDDTTTWRMNYEYKASVAVVEAPEKDGRSVGKGSISHRMTSNEKVVAKEKNSCDRGKSWKEMTCTMTSKTEVSGDAQKVDANVNVGLNADGTYTVSVGLPQIQGKVSGSTGGSCSGQCTPKEVKNFSQPATATSIDGQSLISETQRLNPSDPNRISGSSTKSWQGVVETISWNLQRCGAPLRFVDMTFEHPKFPDFNDWTEITEQIGTIDGNMVRIKATILNASGETKYADVRFKETYKGDKWDGARPDAQLSDTTISTRVEANDYQDVELVWDSSGYAWYDDGRPRLVQRIKAELDENGKKTDELTKNLKVAPKPLVLVHGLWSNWKAWETWQNILTTSHSYDWKAFPVGEKPDKGVMNTGGAFLSTDPTNGIFENSQQLGRYIRYAQEDRNAWHVDIVAHSMGGLISRHYIHQFMPADSPDGRPQVSHLVMLGTPNMGSPCADVMNSTFEVLGKNVEAIRQLQPAVVADFNKVNINRKGVKFSVLAGNPLPVMCKTVVWNDGVVPVESAIWTIKDNAISKSLHTELTGTSDFSSFVKPRLAIGPKGNHNPDSPDVQQFRNQINQNLFEPRFLNASFASTQDSRPFFAKEVRLAAGQSIEMEVTVPNVSNIGVTFMADAKVSVSLFDDKGVLAGKNLADSPESRSMFRNIYVERAANGKWKLVLENTGQFEAAVVLGAWTNATRTPERVSD